LGWPGLRFPMFGLRINGKAGDDTLAAGTGDDPSFAGHPKTIGEVAAKVKSDYNRKIAERGEAEWK
jgi:hypothetical protein